MGGDTYITVHMPNGRRILSADDRVDYTKLQSSINYLLGFIE